MSNQVEKNEYDVFEDDLFAESETHNSVLGTWGMYVLHAIKIAFVIYSGAHNIQAALSATGSSIAAVVSQVVGVVILEAAILGIYGAAVYGKITGKFQSVLTAVFWVTGIVLASLGIVADSRVHAGYELTGTLQWHLETGLFIAPVIMAVGTALIVITDPVISQNILNMRDRASIKREKVKAAVIAERANHQSRKIVHNIRLAAQKQLAIEAKKYYKSPEVQEVLQDVAVSQLRSVMLQAGIVIPDGQQSTQSALPDPATPAKQETAVPNPPTQKDKRPSWQTYHPLEIAVDGSGLHTDAPRQWLDEVADYYGIHRKDVDAVVARYVSSYDDWPIGQASWLQFVANWKREKEQADFLSVNGQNGHV